MAIVGPIASSNLNIPPQDREYTFSTPILDNSRMSVGACKGLVKRLANCSEEEMWAVATFPAKTLSQTRWQSSSMCLVRSWNTALAAICIAAKLSQNKVAGSEMVTQRSLRKKPKRCDFTHDRHHGPIF